MRALLFAASVALFAIHSIEGNARATSRDAMGATQRFDTTSSVVRIRGLGQCSGVRVSTFMALTAAHCVGKERANVKVASPVGGPEVGGVVAAASTQADIAVLCVAPFPSGVAAIGPSKPDSGATVQLVGTSKGVWGHSRIIRADPSGFVVDAVGNLPCYGDSGSPAFFNGAVVAVARHIAPPHTCSTFAQYSDVTSLRVDLARIEANAVCKEFKNQLHLPL